MLHAELGGCSEGYSVFHEHVKSFARSSARQRPAVHRAQEVLGRLWKRRRSACWVWRSFGVLPWCRALSTDHLLQILLRDLARVRQAVRQVRRQPCRPDQASPGQLEEALGWGLVYRDRLRELEGQALLQDSQEEGQVLCVSHSGASKLWP